MRRDLSLVLGLVVVSSLAAGCGSVESDNSQEDDSTATQYLDARAFLSTPAQQASWTQALTKIEGEFNDVCGDTFCGGDYSNLTSLDLTCSVTSKAGDVHDCVWTFGGSSELVQPQTGGLTISKPSFQCHFTAKTTVSKMLATLNAAGTDRAIQRPLAGGTTSIYDALGDCFQHPISATPLSPVYSDHPSYDNAMDVDGTDVDGLISAQSNLASAFATECQDSYCEGAVKNYQLIRLVCAESDTTKNIKSCAAVVSGSASTVSTTKGTVSVTAKSYRCSIPMKGNANDLFTVINADGATPIFDRTITGSTKTFRQAFDACL